jgi:hypothetical protein
VVASSPFRVSRFLVAVEFRKANRPRANVVVGPFGGVAGHAGAMRAIARSMMPLVCPR